VKTASKDRLKATDRLPAFDRIRKIGLSSAPPHRASRNLVAGGRSVLTTIVFRSSTRFIFYIYNFCCLSPVSLERIRSMRLVPGMHEDQTRRPLHNAIHLSSAKRAVKRVHRSLPVQQATMKFHPPLSLVRSDPTARQLQLVQAGRSYHRKT